METHKAKRVEIIIEAALESRLTNALRKAGVTGYTVLPVKGGSGRSGRWSREGQVSRAGGMVAVVCLIRPDRLDALLDAAFAVVEPHIGVVSITDAEALEAFQLSCETEGIIPALEPSHALAHVTKIAPELPKDHLICMNMCGRGDKDIFTVADALGREI
mgnify:CR=1 FL=1